jgi:hypothetical protein
MDGIYAEVAFTNNDDARIEKLSNLAHVNLQSRLITRTLSTMGALLVTSVAFKRARLPALVGIPRAGAVAMQS